MLKIVLRLEIYPCSVLYQLKANWRLKLSDGLSWIFKTRTISLQTTSIKWQTCQNCHALSTAPSSPPRPLTWLLDRMQPNVNIRRRNRYRELCLLLLKFLKSASKQCEIAELVWMKNRAAKKPSEIDFCSIFVSAIFCIWEYPEDAQCTCNKNKAAVNHGEINENLLQKQALNILKRLVSTAWELPETEMCHCCHF